MRNLASTAHNKRVYIFIALVRDHIPSSQLCLQPHLVILSLPASLYISNLSPVSHITETRLSRAALPANSSSTPSWPQHVDYLRLLRIYSSCGFLLFSAWLRTYPGSSPYMNFVLSILKLTGPIPGISFSLLYSAIKLKCLRQKVTGLAEG